MGRNKYLISYLLTEPVKVIKTKYYEGNIKDLEDIQDIVMRIAIDDSVDPGKVTVLSFSKFK